MHFAFPFSFFFFFLFIFGVQISVSSSQKLTKILSFSGSNPTWTPTQNQILVSQNAAFAAGFQPLPTSPNLFCFSVWYFNISVNTIVWSANWDSPVSKFATLTVNNGQVRLVNTSNGLNLWPNSTKVSDLTELKLRNDGNLVFGSWESFDFPTDTVVATQPINGTMKLSSRNGKFSFVQSQNLMFNGTGTYWTNSAAFSKLDLNGQIMMQNAGTPILSSDLNLTRIRRLTLDNDGNLRVYSFNTDKAKWVVVWLAMLEICQVHGLCGSGSICMSNGSTLSGYTCVCPPGFRWGSYPGVCVRKTPFGNLADTKFLRLDYVNYSGGSNQTYQKSLNFDDCSSTCMGYRNCLGFGYKYNGTNYCVLQLDNLLNGYWSPGTQTAMYIRVDGSEHDNTNFTGMSEVLETTCPIHVSLPLPPKESDTTARNIAIISTLFITELVTGFFLVRSFLTRYVKYRDMARTLGLELLPAAGPKRFNYAEIKAATNDFSNDNVIGKGGFSDVYIGKLPDGRTVAVKLLKNAAGGDAEFWAEVTVIARMHHLNLVRLWGFCNEKGRRILIYEHIPNGSLDKFLFRLGREKDSSSEDGPNEVTGPGSKPVLDWNIRYRIALGVARAIAYLHEECLEWVLHCDIKPENILLADDFCPKISDFGLSKLRKREQIVTMSKIRGTRGYLAPEWVKNESITSKVDVYSFGLVLLEIISGARNFAPQETSTTGSEEWYFPKWAYEKAFEEKKIEEILDRQIKNCYDQRVHMKMVVRMVKTAMWCLQERPEQRPSMGKVAKMIEGTVEIMDPPKPSIFYIQE